MDIFSWLKMKNYFKNIIFGINSAVVWKKIERKPIYNKFLKTKINSYDKVGSNCTCLAVILIDFIV